MRKELDERSIEKLELLAGIRASAPLEQAAVRIDDLKEILRLSNLKSEVVTTTPTAEQHNALVADVKEIHLRLNAIAQALQQRLIR